LEKGRGKKKGGEGWDDPSNPGLVEVMGKEKKKGGDPAHAGQLVRLERIPQGRRRKRKGEREDFLG